MSSPANRWALPGRRWRRRTRRPWRTDGKKLPRPTRHSTGDWGWDEKRAAVTLGTQPPIMHWGWLRGTGPSLARHIPEMHYKMLRDKKGRKVHQQPRRPEREESPPHLSPLKEKPRAWARTATDSPSHCLSLSLPPFVSLSCSSFSVQQTIPSFFLTRPPNVWLYCAVYSPLTHFQRWLGIIILNPVGPPLSLSLSLEPWSWWQCGSASFPPTICRAAQLITEVN